MDADCAIIASHFAEGKHNISQVFDAIVAIRKDSAAAVAPAIKALVQSKSNWALCEYIEAHFEKQDDGIIDFKTLKKEKESIDCSIMLETISEFLEKTRQSVDFDARANELLEQAFRENADDPWMLYSGDSNGTNADLYRDLEIAAERLKCAGEVIILHGAGVSKSAGLPLYSELTSAQRSLLDYDVDRRSKQSQALLYELWKASRAAKPTLYHLFLQVLLQKDLLQQVVTFNIDHLEFDIAKLPQDKVHQLHGTLSQLHCGACHAFMDTATTWTDNGPAHICSVSSRRPRRAQQSIQSPHFHVRMYGCDPCSPHFANAVQLQHTHENAAVLIIAGCSLRTNEQKQMATEMVKHMNATGGNIIYINPKMPSKSIKKLWGPAVLYLQTEADLFAGSILRLLKTSPPQQQQHQSSDWTSIKPSTIADAGQGLFAARFIPANTRIMFYTGERIDHDELLRRYGTRLAIYAIKVHDNLYIDAQDPAKSNVARYINTLFHKDIDRAFNVVFEGRNDDRIAVRTLVDIPAGRELFADYGDEYVI